MSNVRVHDDHSVTLTNKFYQYLKERDEKLSKLEAAGVDNWDGYDYAFEGDEEELDD